MWEYTIVYIGRPLSGDVLDRLNALGADRWELVAVDGGHYIFKRPRNGPPPLEQPARHPPG